MTDLFSASTKTLKEKISISFPIKCFTYYQLKRLKEKYPDYKEIQEMKFEDTLTHSYITGDTAIPSGNRLIFESSKTQQLNIYYPGKFEFDYPVPYDSKIFWKIAGKRLGNWYGILQLIYHIRRFFWEFLMPKFIYKSWGFLFHGNKDIKLWGNWFPWSDVCTEICYRELYEYKNKYNLEQIKLEKVNQNNLSPLDVLDICLESGLINRKAY